MRFLARSLTGVFLAAVTFGLLAFAASLIFGAVAAKMDNGAGEPPARERTFAANVLTVTPQTLTPQTEAFGEILARRTLELRSPRGGRVVALAPGFEDGAAVTEGQVLVRLDPSDATSARDLAQAGVAEAEAEGRDAARALDLARDDLAAAGVQDALRKLALTRQTDLQDRKLGSPAAVETAALAASSAEQAVLSRRGALAQAEARVDQAASTLRRTRISLAEAERALADTEVKATFSGRLNGVTVVEGGLVSANERLAEIIDPDTLEVAFRLSTAQFARLLDADGALITAPVQVRLDVLGAEITAQGVAGRVGAAVGEGASGRLVYATLDTPRGFRPGDFVTVLVAEPPASGVALLPATAVNGDGQLLVLGPQDRLDEVQVTVLRRQGDSVIIDATVVAGREVVAERSPLLGAGIKVKPVRPADTGMVDEVAAAGPSAPVVPETVALTPERRAELIAFVEGSSRMPAEAKARMLEQLAQEQVPVQVIDRLTQRMGG